LKQTSEGLTLNFTAQKTSKIHVLPLYILFPLPKENTTRPIKLINKYLTADKELIFKKYSDQLYNRELKEIGHRAKIDFNLTSHIGRKTLATLLPSMGVSSFVIKDILKHSNIKTTERYVKTDEKRVALDLKNINWR
jgi:integrase